MIWWKLNLNKLKLAINKKSKNIIIVRFRIVRLKIQALMKTVNRRTTNWGLSINYESFFYIASMMEDKIVKKFKYVSDSL